MATADEAQAREVGNGLAETVISQRREARDARGGRRFSTPRGVLVAEGDSWFDYPGTDILSVLVDDHGWDVRSTAHLGDTVESMAYGPSQLHRLMRVFDLIAMRQEEPAAVLLSGGGNDLAGPQLSMVLEHVHSGLPLVNDTMIEQLIDVRMRQAVVAWVSAIQRMAREVFGTALPILIHGYSYPVPDGRGYSILHGWGPIPGPWLAPSFEQKGVDDREARKHAMRLIVGRFDQMLADVAGGASTEGLEYLDVTAALSSGSDYRDSWANELHPTPDGFRRVADLFAAAVDRVVS